MTVDQTSHEAREKIRESQTDSKMPGRNGRLVEAVVSFEEIEDRTNQAQALEELQGESMDSEASGRN